MLLENGDLGLFGEGVQDGIGQEGVVGIEGEVCLENRGEESCVYFGACEGNNSSSCLVVGITNIVEIELEGGNISGLIVLVIFGYLHSDGCFEVMKRCDSWCLSDEHTNPFVVCCLKFHQLNIGVIGI